MPGNQKRDGRYTVIVQTWKYRVADRKIGVDIQWQISTPIFLYFTAILFSTVLLVKESPPSLII